MNEFMKNRNRDSGQVMLLTAMLVSAMVIAATSLAGLLTLYQLRQVTDVKGSGAAIFAADSGIECLSYQFAGNSIDCSSGTLSNGAHFTTTSTAPGVYVSIGTSGRSSRALQINFNNVATSTASST